LRPPWKGEPKCAAAKRYLEALPKRQEEEANTLANLTGWEIEKIRQKMELGEPAPSSDGKWWKNIWK
jgi:hypothetical protein